jgi:hypothetical protein
MNRIQASSIAAAFAVAAFASTASADPPAADAVKQALQAVQAQPGYAARYKASIRKTGSEEPFEQEGKAIRQGDLLYREGRRPGERELSVRIFRRAGRIAVFDLRTEQWLTPDQAGDPGAGRGLEDPDAAMSFLLRATTDASVSGTENAGGLACRRYDVSLDKQKMAEEVRAQFQAAKDLDWQRSEVRTQILIGGEPALPRLFRIEGVLPEQNKPDDRVTLRIEAWVDRYGAGDRIPAPPADAKEILDTK